MSLMAVEGQQNESVFQMLKFSTLPIAKVFVMCLLGFILASKYVNILTPSGRKLLNGLVFTLFLPCLIFTQLGRAVTLQKMLEWWFIPMNILCGTISGSLIGLCVALFVRPPKDYFKFTIVQIGIGNIGNVPLVLIGAMCRDKNNPFGDSKTCDETGSAYISFGQWVGAVILYTYVFYMLSPPATTDSVANGIKPNTEIANSTRVPLLAAEEGIVDNAPKPLDWRSRLNEVMAEVSSFLERSKIKQILQPPIIASILALVIGITPFFFELIQRGPTPEPLCQVMLRVGDLDRSIAFYEKACGMKLLKKKDNPEYKYTIAMLGYAKEEETTVLELTYNYGVTEYTKGNAYAQIALGTDDVYKSAEAIRIVIQKLGGKITREPGPIPGLNTKITSFLDPDGWKVVFVDNADFLKELQ